MRHPVVHQLDVAGNGDRVSRRGALTSAALLALPFPVLADAAASPGVLDDATFLALSRAATGHGELLAVMAARLRAALQAADAGFAGPAAELAALLQPDLEPEALLEAQRGRLCAGITADFCIGILAKAMAEEGYDMRLALNTSGNYSEMALHASIANPTQHGVEAISWLSTFCEWLQDWADQEKAAQLACKIQGASAAVEHAADHAGHLEGAAEPWIGRVSSGQVRWLMAGVLAALLVTAGPDSPTTMMPPLLPASGPFGAGLRHIATMAAGAS